MTARTDIHRPSAIKPEEYTWVSFKYYGGSDLGAILAMKIERERLAEHMSKTGGKFSGHDHGGICHVCGQGNISYACVFYHAASNSYIITGEDCAQKIEMSYGDMNAFRRAVHSALEAVAGKKKAQAILENDGLTRCWELYTMNFEDLPGEEVRAHYGIQPGQGPETYKRAFYEEVTIRDIVGKLIKYGSISEKATGLLRKLLTQIDSRAERLEQRAAEKESAAPCPTGRVEITGVVLSVKTQDSDFGPVTKMLVKADSGFKVYGTRTANFEVGQRVKFTAAVTPSTDDPKFGFFKRPTKGEVLGQKWEKPSFEQTVTLEP